MKWDTTSEPARAEVAPAILELIERQARAWEAGDPDLALADWDPDGQLTAPGANVPTAELADEIRSFHAEYRHLRITLTNLMASGDGNRVALEWDWEVTERASGVRTLTKDAIMVDLHHGRIVAWREYFDPGSSLVVPEP